MLPLRLYTSLLVRERGGRFSLEEQVGVNGEIRERSDAGEGGR